MKIYKRGLVSQREYDQHGRRGKKNIEPIIAFGCDRHYTRREVSVLERHLRLKPGALWAYPCRGKSTCLGTDVMHRVSQLRKDVWTHCRSKKNARKARRQAHLFMPHMKPRLAGKRRK